METIHLEAERRTLRGRKVRQLRRNGIVPVVVYGAIDEPELIQVNARSLNYAIQEGGGSQLVEVQVANGPMHNVLIREVQRHPVRRNIIHADFYAVRMDEKQEVAVPVIGHDQQEYGVGFMMLQALDQVNIEALPNKIPASIQVDLSTLTMDEPITVADLPQLDGVEYLDEADEAVFTVVATREEEDVEAAEGDIEEGAEPELVDASDEDADAEASGEDDGE